MVLKYKIKNETSQLIEHDKRFSYVDDNIKNIAKFIYAYESHKIKKIKMLRFLKLEKLKELNIMLINKKGIYKKIKLILKTNFKKFELEKNNYHSSMVDNTVLFLLVLENRLNGFSSEKSRKEAEKKLKEMKTEHKIKFINIENIETILNNINYDIDHINEIRKGIKDLFRYYENLNLSYDQQSKISLFDIAQLHKQKLTHNMKTIFYFYLRKYKITNARVLSYNDIKPLFKSLFKQKEFKELIKNSMENSFKEFQEAQILKRMGELEKQILNKWI